MDADKRQKLIDEIVRGFARRKAKRDIPRDLSALKGESLSKEEKWSKLQEILEVRRQTKDGG